MNFNKSLMLLEVTMAVTCGAAATGNGLQRGGEKFNVAILHGTFAHNAEHGEFDAGIKQLGWESAKYKSTKVDMERLTGVNQSAAGELSGFDMVLFCPLFGYTGKWAGKEQPIGIDMRPYAPAFKKFVEEGGALVLTDCLYPGYYDWLTSIDPTLGVGRESSCANGPDTARCDKSDSLCSIPNTAFVGSSWGHLVIPKGNSWKVLSTCGCGNPMTLVKRMGKGYILLTGLRLKNGSTAESLENLRTSLEMARMGLRLTKLSVDDFVSGPGAAVAAVKNISGKTLTLTGEFIAAAANDPELASITKSAEITLEPEAEKEISVSWDKSIYASLINNAPGQESSVSWGKSEDFRPAFILRSGEDSAVLMDRRNFDVRKAAPIGKSEVRIDLTAKRGVIKRMNAVNNGPIKAGSDQTRGNFEYWKAAKIPFARTHDSAPYVDVHLIFQDFSADPDDPASYDFMMTDIYLKTMMDAGTEVFYRLGATIEHQPRKRGTIPPPDFNKWAVICEHIIRHYNEGWADGHHWNIRYWEIWNEPNLDPDDAPNKRCWGGSEEQFHEFYRVAALHLKKCFPDLLIGGPGMADGNLSWADYFLADMSGKLGKERVPLDFFSWHIYAVTPEPMAERAHMVRELLDKYGYTETESILNEYNYVRGWTDLWVYSLEQMAGIKGAIFTAAGMCLCQEAPLDMLMYYDARPGGMNGLFDSLTMRPGKGYYVFTTFAKLRALGTEAATECSGNGIYALSATNGKGKFGTMICAYTDDDNDHNPRTVEITLKGGDFSDATCRLLDKENNLSEIPFEPEDNHVKIRITPNSMVFIAN